MAGLAIHQFVPTLAARDAIGQHTLGVRRILHEEGIASEIFVENVTAPELRDITAPYRSFLGGAPDERTVLLYQASVGSRIADFLIARPEPLWLDYHNITPASFFEPWDPMVSVHLRSGRAELSRLANRTEMGLADSAFNAAELDALGYRASAVVPILLDPKDFAHDVDDAALARLQREHRGTDWLFVGRIAPNKAQHDLVKAFACYQRVFDPEARLHIVGGYSSREYHDAVFGFARELGLGDQIDFAGSVSAGELAAHYANADVFVCVSEHEGFCVPLLEAMWHGVPVVAYAAGAVPETVGAGGTLLDRKDPMTVAAAVWHGQHDPERRARMIAAARERVAAFAPARTREALLAAIAPLLATV